VKSLDKFDMGAQLFNQSFMRNFLLFSCLCYK